MGELKVHGFLYYRVPRGLRTREVRKKVHDAVEALSGFEPRQMSVSGWRRNTSRPIRV